MNKVNKIFSSLIKSHSMDDLFELWYEDKQHNDNFLMYIGVEEDEVKESFDEEIYDGDDYPQVTYNKDLIEVDFKKYKKNFDKHLEEIVKEKARDWFEDRHQEFIHDFEKHIEISAQGIIAYRSLSVSDPETFLLHASENIFEKDYSGVGIYWSFDKNRAESHWSNGSKHEIVLKAIIPFSAIDQKTTFLLNFDPSTGADEAEIRVVEGSELIILGTDEEHFDTSFKVIA